MVPFVSSLENLTAITKSRNSIYQLSLTSNIAPPNNLWNGDSLPHNLVRLEEEGDLGRGVVGAV